MRSSGPSAPNRRARVGRSVRLPPSRATSPAPRAVAPDAVVPVAVAPGLILVGRLGAPQGVRGALRVQSFTADPAALGAYGDLCDAGGTRLFRLADLRPLKDAMLVATIAGIDDRDGAAALTGTDLYARRANLPAPEEDEVYVADLVGIEAVDGQGNAVGTIVTVLNHGAGDILELAPVEGGETLLIPFTRAFVPEVDVVARRVVIVTPSDDDEGP